MSGEVTGPAGSGAENGAEGSALRARLQPFNRMVAVVEPAALLLVSPLLLFPAMRPRLTLVALAVLAGLASRKRALRYTAIVLPVVLLLALGCAAALLGPERLVGSGAEGVVGSISLSGRIEIWSRALYAIQDFPFTGTGLGTFRRVVGLLYPLFTIGPDVDIAHAHNMFLQVALDVGLPGLIAYLVLGSKPGVAFWLALGLLAALPRVVAAEAAQQ